MMWRKNSEAQSVNGERQLPNGDTLYTQNGPKQRENPDIAPMTFEKSNRTSDAFRNLESVLTTQISFLILKLLSLDATNLNEVDDEINHTKTNITKVIDVYLDLRKKKNTDQLLVGSFKKICTGNVFLRVLTKFWIETKQPKEVSKTICSKLKDIILKENPSLGPFIEKL